MTQGTDFGSMTGGGSLIVNGTGTVILSAANGYSGGSTLNSGTVLAGDSSAFGSGAVNINGITLGSTTGVNLANSINVTGANTIGSPSQASNITLSGSIAGSGTLSNYVGGTTGYNVFLTGDMSGFNGTINYTCDSGAATGWWRVGTSNGTTNLSNAALILNKGNITDANALSKNFGFTDGITGAVLQLGALSGDGVFQASFNNSGPNTLQVGFLNTNTTFSGTIAGAAAGTQINFVKVGSGTLTLSGGNEYTGTTNVTSGTLNVSGALNVNNNNNAGILTVGDTSGSTGVLNITGTVNATHTSAPSVNIGNNSGAVGIVNVNGGTLNTSSEVWVSSASGASGTLNINAGQVTVGSWLAVGRGGSDGNLVVSGGTLNVNNQPLTIASFAADVGSVTVTGGVVNSSNSVNVGETGTGQMLVSQTGIVNVGTAGRLWVARNSGSTGTLNLGDGTPGGLITTQQVTTAGNSTFNFNGGTLRAALGTTSFFQGLTTAQIRNGGGTIDTNAFSITVAQPLLHSTIGGDNAVDGGLKVVGGGTLIMSGASTYSGNTTVTAGTLDVTGSLGGTPVVAINGGNAIVDASGALASTVAVTGNNTASNFIVNQNQTVGSMNLLGATTVATAATLTVNPTGTSSAGPISGAGTLAVTGTGNLTAQSVQTSALTVAAGSTATIAYDAQAHTHGTPIGTSVVTTLSVDSAGTLDLKNNGIVILDTTSLGAVKSLITQAADVSAGIPHWDMPGITSSTAAADHSHAIGYALASTLPGGGSTSFNGVSFSDAVIARYTLVGDTGLKGTVDLSDYTKVVLNLGKSNAGWSDGNFDYSGNVNLGDYTAVIRNLGRSDGQSTVFNATGPSAQQVKASALTLHTAPAVTQASTSTDVTLLVNPTNGRVTLVNALQTGQAVITAYTINSPSQSLLPFSADGGGKYLANALENNPSVFYKASNGLTYNLWTGIKNVSTFIGEGFSNHYNANVDSTWTNYTLATSGYALGTLFKRLSSGGTKDLVFQWEDANLNTYTSVVTYVGAVPEPGSVSLIAVGAMAMLGRRRRRR